MEQRFQSLGFRVQLTEDEGVWIATARRIDTGDMFGPPVPADRADEAADLLARWLEWQQAHTSALHALQAAEGHYHRLAADQFASPSDGARAAVRAALVDVDERRRQLDDIRGQRPWPH
jgi:hypothetical protein